MMFLDSRMHSHNDRTKVLLPSRPFTASGEEKMSLTLMQFSMRRNWYNINETNNQGYVHNVTDDTYHHFEIEPKAYYAFESAQAGDESLKDAVNQAFGSLCAQTTATGGLSGIISSIVAAYDTQTRKFTFTVEINSGHRNKEFQFRLFSVKQGLPPAGVTAAGFYNDAHEILGGVPKRRSNDLQNAFEHVSGHAQTRTFKSVYPCSLNTLDALYIRLSALETGCYCSTQFDKNIIDDDRINETDIFARIPLERSTFDEVHEVVEYVTDSDQFQVFPLRKHINELEIRITDAKGRSLAEVAPDQAANGLMGFQMVLRFDLFKPPAVQQPISGSADSESNRWLLKHPPTR